MISIDYLLPFLFLMNALSLDCNATQSITNRINQDPINVLIQVRNDNKDKDFSKKIFRRIDGLDHDKIRYHTEPMDDIKYDILSTIVITEVKGTENTETTSNVFRSSSPQGQISTPFFPTRQGDGNAIAVVFAGGTVPVRPAQQVTNTTVTKNILLGAQVVITDLTSGKELLTEYFSDEEKIMGPKVNTQRSTEDMIEDSLDDLARMVTRYLNRLDLEDLASL